MKYFLGIIISLIVIGDNISARNVNIIDFGCKGDGLTEQSNMIQKAIDVCAESGGGQVIVPNGTYITGTIILRSNVELHLEKGAILKGSHNHPQDYIKGRGVIIAKNAENIAITGFGVIDGQGDHPIFQQYGNNEGNRPHAIFFEDCRNITVRDINIRNSAWWTFRLFRCDGVTIDRIRIYTYSIVNNDGIDVDAKNVTISNCYIEAEDDGICMKSDDPLFPVENIAITNCIIASNCNPIKFGTSSFSTFRNITVSNCVIRRPSESHVWDWSKEYREIPEGTLTGLSGIAVESVVGADIDGLSFSNITMEGIITPIFVCLGARRGKPGSIKNLLFSNIYARAEGLIPCLISAVPGYKIEGITLRDIIIEQTGGGTLEDAKSILQENPTGYPENRMYGESNPAAGLYIRHAKNIFIDNFQIKTIKPDVRSSIVMADVQESFINNLYAEANKKQQSMIRLRDCQNIEIAHCRFINSKRPKYFVSLEGECREIFVKTPIGITKKNILLRDRNIRKKDFTIINR